MLTDSCSSLKPNSAARSTKPSQTTDGITILYDAFGSKSELKKDWGFSALIEYQGKRILFDTVRILIKNTI